MDGRLKNNVKTLIIGDNELECECDKLTLQDLNANHIGFAASIINEYELIIYEGKKGTKILKSRYTKTGVVE